MLGKVTDTAVDDQTLVDAAGTVTAIDGDYALVRLDDTGCGRCHEEGGCGGHNIGSMLCRTPTSYRVVNPAHAQLGDRVQISIAPGAVRRGAMLAYGWPLLALLAGALAGSALAGDGGAIIGALVALVCAWLVLRRYMPARSGAGTDSEPYIRS